MYSSGWAYTWMTSVEPVFLAAYESHDRNTMVSMFELGSFCAIKMRSPRMPTSPQTAPGPGTRPDPDGSSWRVSLAGRRPMTTAIKLREVAYPSLFAAAA